MNPSGFSPWHGAHRQIGESERKDMTAEIIQFGDPKSLPAQIDARELANQIKKVNFVFGGDEYEASFRGGELWHLQRIYYRMQNGRHAKCRHRVRYPAQYLIDAAQKHLAGKGTSSAAKPDMRAPSTAEPDARTIDMITRLDALKKITTWAIQQLKAGRVPQDVMEAFKTYLAPR
jgi:hypothetical protein